MTFGSEIRDDAESLIMRVGGTGYGTNHRPAVWVAIGAKRSSRSSGSFVTIVGPPRKLPETSPC
jgi:hypothetical protein